LLGDLAYKKVPKLLGQYLAEKQNILGRALTQEEIKSAQHFFTRTQELIHAPNATALAAEAEQICKYANYYGESRVFDILKSQRPGEAVSKAIHGSIKKDWAKVPQKFSKHFLVGEMDKKGRLSGWHQVKPNPTGNKIIKIVRGPNKHGIREVNWIKDGAKKAKWSTLGPNSWGYLDHLKSLREAYCNLFEIKNKKCNHFTLKGTDHIGIKWKIEVERKGRFDKLKTAYPLFEE